MATVGAENVRDAREADQHAAGRIYPDLVRIRSGDASRRPDAVVLPGSRRPGGAVLAACAEHRVAVVPFGGGTSVVGGVEPVRDGMAAVVSLDLGRLDRRRGRPNLAHRSPRRRPVRPGGRAAAWRRGLTLGHFPQSFEYSTVGGWVATRSAGQASTGYGRIDELVEAVRCVAPVGEIGTRAVPAPAAGPTFASCSWLGGCARRDLRGHGGVRPAPGVRRYEGWSFASFAEGCDAFRVMEQAEASADVIAFPTRPRPGSRGRWRPGRHG